MLYCHQLLMLYCFGYITDAPYLLFILYWVLLHFIRYIFICKHKFYQQQSLLSKPLMCTVHACKNPLPLSNNPHNTQKTKQCYDASIMVRRNIPNYYKIYLQKSVPFWFWFWFSSTIYILDTYPSLKLILVGCWREAGGNVSLTVTLETSNNINISKVM